MAQFKLIQHKTLKSEVKDTRKVEEPPMSAFPDCDLCLEPGGIVTPEGMAFCGPCWRAHNEFIAMQEKFGE